MTEYDIQVEQRRDAIEKERWDRQVKYVHINNGIMEVAYNNGVKEITRLR
jgi:hypothetical protein